MPDQLSNRAKTLIIARHHLEWAQASIASARKELREHGWPDAAEMTMPATKQLDIWLNAGGIFDQLEVDDG